MAGGPFIETSTEKMEHNAAERRYWQPSRCWICLLHNDLVRHTDVQLLVEAWGMSSYARKHCTQQPIRSFPTISLFSVPLSLDTVYLNCCPCVCICPLFTSFCDQGSILMSTWLTLHTPRALIGSPMWFLLNIATTLHLNDLCKGKQHLALCIFSCSVAWSQNHLPVRRWDNVHREVLNGPTVFITNFVTTDDRMAGHWPTHVKAF